MTSCGSASDAVIIDPICVRAPADVDDYILSLYDDI